MSTPTISHPTNLPNFTVVDSGPVAYAFSYKTCVGFNVGTGWNVVENSWGPTTGKHLNWLDEGDKAGRMDSATFTAALEVLHEEAA
jgi:hypothetical protein